MNKTSFTTLADNLIKSESENYFVQKMVKLMDPSHQLKLYKYLLHTLKLKFYLFEVKVSNILDFPFLFNH